MKITKKSWHGKLWKHLTDKDPKNYLDYFGTLFAFFIVGAGFSLIFGMGVLFCVNSIYPILEKYSEPSISVFVLISGFLSLRLVMRLQDNFRKLLNKPISCK